MNSLNSLNYRLSAACVRDNSIRMLKDCLEGKTHFSYHEENWPSLVRYVAEVCRENYPDLKIPFHCRWNHFKFQSKHLVEEALKKGSFSDEDKGRALFDLMIVSVLLDAGAGDAWRFQLEGESIGRSEGLALASWEMFRKGLFSSKANTPWQVDASGLLSLKLSDLAEGMQVSEKNPLIGLEARLNLLQGLGKVLKESSFFQRSNRPSDLLDTLSLAAVGKEKILPLPTVLHNVLRAFGGLWPSKHFQIDEKTQEQVALGDTWLYAPWNELISFHKLSQWLSYSLVLPCEYFGLKVSDVNGLTGLPEYRNGGLFIDLDVLQWRDKANIERSFTVEHPAIIEWRALTVALLDKLADDVRKELNRSPEELSLTAVLEGGSWAAGRKIARAKRPHSMSSPIKLESTGTVF
jgi:hypothetical protein